MILFVAVYHVDTKDGSLLSAALAAKVHVLEAA
jgi:hypothetical protein